MADRRPDFQCTACGVDMFVFPSGSDWDTVAEGYRNCGLHVAEPHCGQCVIEGVKARKFALSEEGSA